MYVDITLYTSKEQQMIAALRREIVDARLDVRDYELSETRAEQITKSAEATKRLRSVNQSVTDISGSGTFGAADVALYTAKIEQIIANLK